MTTEGATFHWILQSTSLIRGKTEAWQTTGLFFTLQSTSLIRGKTLNLQRYCYLHNYFNPLPSSEGRLPPMELHLLSCVLQSTSLIRGKTINAPITYGCITLQSTSLIRGKTAKLPDSFLKSKYIFSTFIQFLLLSL